MIIYLEVNLFSLLIFFERDERNDAIVHPPRGRGIQMGTIRKSSRPIALSAVVRMLEGLCSYAYLWRCYTFAFIYSVLRDKGTSGKRRGFRLTRIPLVTLW